MPNSPVLVFDAFGTLVSLSSQPSAEKLAGQHVRSMLGVEQHTSFVQAMLTTGMGWEEWLSKHGLLVSPSLRAQWTKHHQDRMMSFSVLPYTLELLKWCHEQRYRVVVASNLSLSYAPLLKAWAATMQSCGVPVELFLSCQEGVCKPNPMFFARLVERTSHTDPIMIGNDLRDDIEGARGAGWRTIHTPSGVGHMLNKQILQLVEMDQHG